MTPVLLSSFRLAREAEEQRVKEEEQEKLRRLEEERARALEKLCLDALWITTRDPPQGDIAPKNNNFRRVLSVGLDVGPETFNVTGRLAVWEAGGPLVGFEGRVVLVFSAEGWQMDEWPIEDLVGLQNSDNGRAIALLLAHHQDDPTVLKPNLVMGDFKVPVRLIPLYEAMALREQLEQAG